MKLFSWLKKRSIEKEFLALASKHGVGGEYKLYRTPYGRCLNLVSLKKRPAPPEFVRDLQRLIADRLYNLFTLHDLSAS